MILLLYNFYNRQKSTTRQIFVQRVTRLLVAFIPASTVMQTASIIDAINYGHTFCSWRHTQLSPLSISVELHHHSSVHSGITFKLDTQQTTPAPPCSSCRTIVSELPRRVKPVPSLQVFYSRRNVHLFDRSFPDFLYMPAK